VYITDRLADVILVGDPAEIEAALDEHPAVRSCCVIGLPDEDLGNIPYAIVELSEPATDEDLMAHLRQRLARTNCPGRSSASPRRCAMRPGRSAAQRCGPNGSPSTQPSGKPAEPRQKAAHAMYQRPDGSQAISPTTRTQPRLPMPAGEPCPRPACGRSGRCDDLGPDGVTTMGLCSLVR